MKLIDLEELQAQYDINCSGDCMCCRYNTSTSCKVIDESPIVNAIPIPEGATNGDMIKAMFPQGTCTEYGFLIKGSFNSEVSVDWWDAPYRKE